MKAKKDYVRNNRKVQEVKYDVIEWNGDHDSYVILVIKVTPYSQEELQEMAVYGDPQHEEYLCSDDYEADCRSEQWDWLKGEMG